MALRLAVEEATTPDEHQLLAPTLFRSQLLTMLYQAVRAGSMTKTESDHHLGYVRGLRLRLLGDHVLQNAAWKVASQLDWPDTYQAEYVALAQLQADAFITLDKELASAVRRLVTIAPFKSLSRKDRS